MKTLTTAALSFLLALTLLLAPPASAQTTTVIAHNGFTVAQLQPLWQHGALGQNTCPPGGGPYELYDTFLATGQTGACPTSAEQQYRDNAMAGWHMVNPNANDSAYLAEAASIYNSAPGTFVALENAFLARMFANLKPAPKPAVK